MVLGRITTANNNSFTSVCSTLYHSLLLIDVARTTFHSVAVAEMREKTRYKKLQTSSLYTLSYLRAPPRKEKLTPRRRFISSVFTTTSKERTTATTTKKRRQKYMIIMMTAKIKHKKEIPLLLTLLKLALWLETQYLTD